MHSTFRAVLLAFTLLLQSSVALAASGGAVEINNACANIVTTTGISKEHNPKDICNQDMMAASLNMLFSDTYDKSSSMRSAFSGGGIPSPSSANVITDTVGGMVTAMNTASLSLFVFVCFPLIFIMLLIKSTELLKSESWGEAFKSPEVWGSATFFMLMAILSFIQDGVMVGQTLVIAGAGIALGFANQLMTGVLLAFTIDTTVSDTTSDPAPYIESGQLFAVNLIVSSQAARDTTSLGAKVNNKRTDESNYFNGNNLLPYAESTISQILSPYKERNITVAEHINQLLTSKVIEVRHTMPTSLGFFGGVDLKDMSFLSFRSADGMVDDGKRYYETVYPDIKIGSLYEGLDVHRLNISTPKTSPEILTDVAIKGFGFDFFSAVYGTDASSKTIAAASRPMINAMAGTGQDYLAYMESVPYLQLGILSEKDIANNELEDRVSYINPRERSPFTGGKNKILNKILNDAYLSGENLLAAGCAQALLDSDKQDHVISEIWLNKALEESPSALTSSGILNSIQAESYAQCFSLVDGEPVFLIKDLTDKFEKDLLSSDIKDTERKEVLILNEAKIRKFIDSKTGEARRIRDNIALYYASILASNAYVNFTVISKDDPMDTGKLLTEMRQKGASSLYAYFYQMGSVMDRFRKAIAIVDISITQTASYDNQSLIPPLAEKGMIENAFDNMLSALKFSGHEDAEAAKMVDVEALKPFGAFFSTALVSDLDMSIMDDDSVAEMSTESMGDDYISTVAEYMVPGTSILKSGFGFPEGQSLKKSYQDCATVTNCVEMSAHPLIIMSEFGKDLLGTALAVVVADLVLQGLANLDVEKLIAKIAGQADAALGSGNLIGNLAGKLSIFSGGIYILMGVIKFLAVVSSIFAFFAKILLVAGILLGYLLPIIPIITGVFLWAGWLFEVLILYLIFPIIAFMALIRIEGKPLISFGTITGMFASILIKPMIYVICFLSFYALSYVMFYLVNSVAFYIFSQAGGASDNPFMAFFGTIIGIVLVMFIYYKVLIKVNNEIAQVPEHICSYLGVRSFSVVAATGAEQMIQAKAISSVIESSIESRQSRSREKRDNKKEMKELEGKYLGQNDGSQQSAGSSQGFDPSGPDGPSAGNTPPSGPSGGNTPPAGPSAGNTPLAGPSGGNTPPAGPSGGNTPPAGPSAGNTPPAGPSAGNTPLAGEQPNSAQSTDSGGAAEGEFDVSSDVTAPPATSSSQADRPVGEKEDK